MMSESVCAFTIVVDQLRRVAAVQFADVFEGLDGVFDEVSGRRAIGRAEGVARHIELRSVMQAEDRLHEIGQRVIAEI